MNTLIEKKRISELVCGENFSYVLGENQIFSSTEYKVLQSQTDSCFVRCMKMLYNGQVQLYYLTGEYKPLSSLIPSLDPDSFLVITANMLSDMIEVKQNGFLSCQNIDISFDHIYVDPTNYKISLIYLPLTKKIYSDYSVFENEIRTSLIRLITSNRNLSSNKTIQFTSDLSNGMLTLEDLHAHIKGGVFRGESVSQRKATETPVKRKAARLRIVAMNAPEHVEIPVTKSSFTIGKKPGMCDAVISFNKMISRAHCRIDVQNGNCTVTDLHSANGTFVNRQKLQPDRPFPIKNGDILRLANSDFQVCMD